MAYSVRSLTDFLVNEKALKVCNIHKHDHLLAKYIELLFPIIDVDRQP